jgi:hypothetical protein
MMRFDGIHDLSHTFRSKSIPIQLEVLQVTASYRLEEGNDSIGGARGEFTSGQVKLSECGTIE